MREHHLASDFRVASLVRLPQRGTAERGQIENRREHPQTSRRSQRLRSARIEGSADEAGGVADMIARVCGRRCAPSTGALAFKIASFRQFSGAVSCLTSRGRLLTVTHRAAVRMMFADFAGLREWTRAMWLTG